MPFSQMNVRTITHKRDITMNQENEKEEQLWIIRNQRRR